MGSTEHGVDAPRSAQSRRDGRDHRVAGRRVRDGHEHHAAGTEQLLPEGTRRELD